MAREIYIQKNTTIEQMIQTNPDKLRCTRIDKHKKCCVVNRWNSSCVCEKCQLCKYCGSPILTDDIEEWKKDNLERVFLQSYHYSCAKRSIIDPMVYTMLRNIHDESTN